MVDNLRRVTFGNNDNFAIRDSLVRKWIKRKSESCVGQC